jgi:hypothetical protein
MVWDRVLVGLINSFSLEMRISIPSLRLVRTIVTALRDSLLYWVNLIFYHVLFKRTQVLGLRLNRSIEISLISYFKSIFSKTALRTTSWNKRSISPLPSLSHFHLIKLRRFTLFLEFLNNLGLILVWKAIYD